MKRPNNKAKNWPMKPCTPSLLLHSTSELTHCIVWKGILFLISSPKWASFLRWFDPFHSVWYILSRFFLLYCLILRLPQSDIYLDFFAVFSLWNFFAGLQLKKSLIYFFKENPVHHPSADAKKYEFVIRRLTLENSIGWPVKVSIFKLWGWKFT